MNIEEHWNALEPSVNGLTIEKQRVFAVFSCARASKYFLAHCQGEDCTDPAVVPELLAVGWHTVGTNIWSTDLASLTDRLRKMGEELERVGTVSAIAAQEACFAGLVLLEILSGKLGTKQVMRIVNFVRDITDMLIQERPNFLPDSDLEQSIWQDPLMQEEFHKHSRILQMLSTTALSREIMRTIREAGEL